MTDEERLVLTETRRLWIQTARSRNPNWKTKEEQYVDFFNCPTCKYHNVRASFEFYCFGDCLLSPVWGSTEGYACEDGPISPYDEWFTLTDAEFPDSRRVRSAAWKLVNGIETMLWNDRLANV